MCLPTPRISAAKRHDGKALTAAGNAKGALGHPPVDTSRVTARAERSKRQTGVALFYLRPNVYCFSKGWILLLERVGRVTLF